MPETLAPLESELTILRDYTFQKNNRHKNDDLLAIKLVNGKKQLTKLSRKDVTTFQLFLRYFGIGKLKGIHISLNSICSHLKKFDWEKRQTSREYEALAHLARRSAEYKGHFCLMKKISVLTHTRLGDFCFHEFTTAKDITLQAKKNNQRKGFRLRKVELQSICRIEGPQHGEITPVKGDERVTPNDLNAVGETAEKVQKFKFQYEEKRRQREGFGIFELILTAFIWSRIF